MNIKVAAFKVSEKSSNIARGNAETSHAVTGITDFKRTGPRSAVGNVSGYKCVPDCKSRGREFDPGPVPYFRGG